MIETTQSLSEIEVYLVCGVFPGSPALCCSGTLSPRTRDLTGGWGNQKLRPNRAVNVPTVLLSQAEP